VEMEQRCSPHVVIVAAVGEHMGGRHNDKCEVIWYERIYILLHEGAALSGARKLASPLL
jgi:hypothetical protein